LASAGFPPSDGTTRGRGVFKTLDGLPPIRLPIGPAIPWRYGLPGLVALVVCVALLSRPSARGQGSPAFKLPAETETYAVTQDSPLFTNAQQKVTPSIGVAEPPGLGVDVLDLSLKLVAVLALAYASLAVLKRLGVSGAAQLSQAGGTTDGLRVMASLSLAPNRSVHVVRAPDGKTLLLGATPGQVNLIAELGDVPEVAASASTPSFLDVLASKLQQR
jgi:flagellar biogenesis protein FliO